MSSLREALETAYADETTPEQEIVTPTPEATPEPVTAADPVTTVEPAEGRARNEKGQYLPKEAAQVVEAKPADNVVQLQPEKKAPSSWKPDAQAAFLKAHRGEALTPEEVRLLTEEAERREGDFHKGVQDFKSHADRARAYDQVVQPYSQYLQSLGTDAPSAIAYLLKTEHALRTADPVTRNQEFIKLAQTYGIDVNALADTPPQDPYVQQLMNELQELRHQQNLLHNERNQENQSVANQQIESFKAGHPHFEAVRGDMADLMEMNKALSMEDAYDKAVWMRPDIRTTLLDQQRAEAQKKADEQTRLDKAKAAAASVKGSGSAAAGVQPLKGSLRDVIAAQFADS